jgi:DNA-3-methyladenine glycosylase II
VDGTLEFSDLPELPDEEVIARLTAVKGVGEWTAHMFLMFQLGRPDVLPVGDLGVRNGMRAAYGLPETPTPAQAREIGAPWAPYRSVGSWYMWRAALPGVPGEQVMARTPGG